MSQVTIPPETKKRYDLADKDLESLAPGHWYSYKNGLIDKSNAKPWDDGLGADVPVQKRARKPTSFLSPEPENPKKKLKVKDAGKGEEKPESKAESEGDGKATAPKPPAKAAKTNKARKAGPKPRPKKNEKEKEKEKEKEEEEKEKEKKKEKEKEKKKEKEKEKKEKEKEKKKEKEKEKEKDEKEKEEKEKEEKEKEEKEKEEKEEEEKEKEKEKKEKEKEKEEVPLQPDGADKLPEVPPGKVMVWEMKRTFTFASGNEWQDCLLFKFTTDDNKVREGVLLLNVRLTNYHHFLLGTATQVETCENEIATAPGLILVFPPDWRRMSEQTRNRDGRLALVCPLHRRSRCPADFAKVEIACHSPGAIGIRQAAGSQALKHFRYRSSPDFEQKEEKQTREHRRHGRRAGRRRRRGTRDPFQKIAKKSKGGSKKAKNTKGGKEEEEEEEEEEEPPKKGKVIPKSKGSGGGNKGKNKGGKEEEEEEEEEEEPPKKGKVIPKSKGSGGGNKGKNKGCQEKEEQEEEQEEEPPKKGKVTPTSSNSLASSSSSSSPSSSSSSSSSTSSSSSSSSSSSIPVPTVLCFCSKARAGQEEDPKKLEAGPEQFSMDKAYWRKKGKKHMHIVIKNKQGDTGNTKLEKMLERLCERSGLGSPERGNKLSSPAEWASVVKSSAANLAPDRLKLELSVAMAAG
eukprot:g80443.t1